MVRFYIYTSLLFLCLLSGLLTYALLVNALAPSLVAMGVALAILGWVGVGIGLTCVVRFVQEDNQKALQAMSKALI